MRRLLALVAIALLLGAAFVGWKMYQKGVILDAAEVERIAAQMLPGASPPTGLVAVLAIRPEKDLQAAVFAPSLSKVNLANLSGSDLRIAIAHPSVPQGAQPDFAEIRSKIDAAQSRKAEEMETLAQSPVLIKVGGRPYPAMKNTVALKAGGLKLREYVTVFSPGEHVAVVLITGPEATFNQAAMDQFLAGLKPPDTPAPVSGGSGQPRGPGTDGKPAHPRPPAEPPPGPGGPPGPP